MAIPTIGTSDHSIYPTPNTYFMTTQTSRWSGPNIDNLSEHKISGIVGPIPISSKEGRADIVLVAICHNIRLCRLPYPIILSYTSTG